MLCVVCVLEEGVAWEDHSIEEFMCLLYVFEDSQTPHSPLVVSIASLDLKDLVPSNLH